MEKDDYTLIEQYFEGAFDEDQQAAFNARLAKDEGFAKEFELRKTMQNYLQKLPQKEQLKQDLDKLGADYFQEEEGKVVPLAKKGNNYRWLALATAAAVALLLIIWNPFGQADLYQQYAMHETLNLTEKSVETDILASNAEKAFNQKAYEKAVVALDAYLQKQPEDVKASLFKAISLMELDRLEESRSILKNIQRGNSARKIEAYWYTALTYLKSGETEAAKMALQAIPASEQFWYTKAQKLLKDL